MISLTSRRFSVTPAWLLPTNSPSRCFGIPTWLGFVLFAILLITLVLNQLTAPDGYWNAESVRNGSSVSDSVSKTIGSWSPGSLFGGDLSSEQAQEKNPMLGSDREIKIVITENMSAHDEVVAPLIAAFGSMPGANISAILLSKMDRFGSFEMFRNLQVDSPNPLPEPKNYRSSDLDLLLNDPPDFLVCTSCTQDQFEKYDVLFEKSMMHIFCVVHHSEKWSNDYMFGSNEKRLAKWVAADRVDFITLSPHVAAELPRQLKGWSEIKFKTIPPPVHSFPPIFVLDLSKFASQISASREEISFALQGNFSPARRNFTMVFEELGEMKHTFEETDDQDLKAALRLHMVGSGVRPEVPEGVADMVIWEEGLNYSEFYQTLSNMQAILPAFADEDYFVTKASSSVPAALIAGAPIVATRRMLDTYSYLEEGVVWFQEENETDIDMIWKVLRKPRKEREEKVRNVKALSARLAAQGKQDVARWVNDVLWKRQERLRWLDQASGWDFGKS